MLANIAHTVAEALKLPYAGLELRRDGHYELAASSGTLVGQPTLIQLAHQGETVGRLVLGCRPPSERLTSADRRVLEALAPQAGVAVHAAELAADLQRSRAVLQRSRERLEQARARLVTAREEERRRLRRDLHDEIASTLAGMTLQLDGARTVLTSDPTTAQAILGRLAEETQACITEIRRMIDNLRPAALDQLGLIGALQEKAARFSSPVGTQEWSDGNLVVCVESHSLLPDLPAAVEVAAYRIAEEAMMNTARHARARHCWIRLSANHALELEVTDDGDGLQPGREQGVGLASMKERAAELGGTCAITSTPGQGTRVLARIPLVEV